MTVPKMVDFTGKNPFATRVPKLTTIKAGKLVKDDLINGSRVLSIASRTDRMITVETDQGTVSFRNLADLTVTR